MTDFISEYCDYVDSFSDAPREFSYWMAHFVVSTLLGPKCKMPFGQDNIYPVLWMILVAPSGLYRKTTSLNVAQRILYNCDPLSIHPTATTPVAMLKCINTQPVGCMIFSEFDRFSAIIHNARRTEMTALLTEIFDCPEAIPRVTKSQKMDVCHPFVNIAAGSTLEWLFKRMPQEDLLGGFIPRFLFIAPETKPESVAVQPPVDEGQFMMLLAQAQRIRMMRRDLVHSAASKEYYTDWYKRFLCKIHGNEQLLGPFIVRLTIYAHKLAMIKHIAKGRDSGELCVADVAQACSDVDKVFLTIKDIITQRDIVMSVKGDHLAFFQRCLVQGRISLPEMRERLNTKAFRSFLMRLTDEGIVRVVREYDPAKKRIGKFMQVCDDIQETRFYKLLKDEVLKLGGIHETERSEPNSRENARLYRRADIEAQRSSSRLRRAEELDARQDLGAPGDGSGHGTEGSGATPEINVGGV